MLINHAVKLRPLAALKCSMHPRTLYTALQTTAEIRKQPLVGEQYLSSVRIAIA